MKIFLNSPYANMMLLTLSTSIILLISYLILHTHKKKLTNKIPPGSLGWPIVGETIEFGLADSRSGGMEGFIVGRMRRYCPKVFTTSLMGEKTAVLCGPSGHKFIFSNENKLVKTWATGPVKRILIPHDLSDLTEEDPVRWRKLASEFLKPSALHKCVEFMDSTMRQHMDAEWAPRLNATVLPLAKKLTFKLSWRLFMGIEDVNSAVVARMEDQFDAIVAGLYSGHIDLPGTAYRKALKSAELLRGEIQNFVQKQRLITPSAAAAAVAGSGDDDDQVSCTNLLSHLLSITDSKGNLLSDKEIASLVVVNLTASHGTTSAVFASVVYYLARHPHVYTQALQEIKSLEGGDRKKLLTWEEVKRMKYCRNVVCEVLRLSPPSNGTFRNVLHDIPYEGFTIPKGWKIFWSPLSTHKDPTYFVNPENFDPARFEGDGPAPYTFVPFGGGPRMCPGNEFAIQAALVFMHNLLTKYKWENLNAN